MVNLLTLSKRNTLAVKIDEIYSLVQSNLVIIRNDLSSQAFNLFYFIQKAKHRLEIFRNVLSPEIHRFKKLATIPALIHAVAFDQSRLLSGRMHR